MSESKKVTAFRGDLIHALQFGEIELLPDRIVVVDSFDDGGRIAEIAGGDSEADVLRRYNLEEGSIVRLKV